MLNDQQRALADQLFIEVLALPPDQRPLFLDERCDDPEVRGEIESLLPFAGSSRVVLDAVQQVVENALASAHATRLAEGRQLGRYCIQGVLGKGGMGEVYKARDTRLDRTVAIKVLPVHISSNAKSKERFEREARTIAGLNHPHIGALYDVGQQDGIEFLVMEFIDGETLAARLERGSFGMEQALQIAIQIGDALDSVHRQGIVHRDLKPGNIMLTKSGAKLLDFGLARLRQPNAMAAFASASAAPTHASSLTLRGTILGTLQYMAPEQLEGKDADTRTDIFAFGEMVYETITGRKAFESQSQAGLIGAILEHEPAAMSMLVPTTPPALDRLIRRCLAKDPDRRWQTARDLVEELQWIADSNAHPEPPAANRGSSRLRKRTWLGATILALVIAVAAADTWSHLAKGPAGPTAEKSIVRFDVPPPDGERFSTLAPERSPSPAISPDGKQLVFVAASGPRRLLWIRPIDSTKERPLTGTEGAARPFWSPRGDYIAFSAEGQLKKVAVSGGQVQVLCPLPPQASRPGGTWSKEGILLGQSGGGVLRFPEQPGGQLVPVTELNRSLNETSHRAPHFLPDGRHFTYVADAGPTGEVTATYIGTLDSKERLPLPGIDSEAVYSTTGHMLFIRNGMLMAQAFDPVQLKLSGPALPVAEQFSSIFSTAAFSVSDTGALAYYSGVGHSRLVWFDHSGAQTVVAIPEGEYYDPELSPNGQYVAFERGHPRDVWTLDFRRGVISPFTSDPADDWFPLWSPNGQTILFMSTRKSNAGNLYRHALGIAGADEPFLTEIVASDIASWDERYIVYRQAGDYWAIPLPGPSKPIRLTETPSVKANGRLSPNSHWFAYVSREAGRSQVYIQPFPEPATKATRTLISIDGGVAPRWSRDSTELFFIAPDSTVMSVTIHPVGASVEIGTPKHLFRAPIVGGGSATSDVRAQYDVASDGRLLMNIEGEPGPITVILNWASGLKQ
jgi:serine/threonine protein kinase